MDSHSVNQKTFGFYGASEIRQNIPNLITSLRIVTFPHIIYAFNLGFTPLVYVLFLLGIGTDIVDGYIARKFDLNSDFGAYLDVIVDFLFISGMYLLFICKGFYSPWILVIISATFMQFILSNLYSKRIVYDPVGKYYGSLLVGGIGLTLLFQWQMVYNIITIGIATSAAISIFSRTMYFLCIEPKSR